MRFIPFVFLAGVSFASHAGGASFKLTSNDFKDGAFLPSVYAYDKNGCGGENVSPQLEWKNPPTGTKSFALTMFDPDAPTGHGWWHWIALDIPAKMNAVPQGFGNKKMPGIREGKNDFNESGYGGPCPPMGNDPHRYVFTLYALSVEKIDVSADAAPKDVSKALEKKMLGKAELMGRYQRLAQKRAR